MKKFTLFFIILFLSVYSYALGHFTPVPDNGLDPMSINILSATSGGVDLQAGDEIAVFDGSICCGVVLLTQPILAPISVSISVFPADAGASNGFTSGHAITYKYWDSSENLEISPITGEYINPETNPPTTIVAPTFTSNLSAFVKLYVNRAPTANAGPDQSLNEGSTVTLDGTASSDPDGNTLTYLWSAPSEITLSSTTASNPTFTAPEVMANTDYTFTLVVNDGNVSSTSDQIIVTVKQVNKAPVANAGLDNSVNENALFTLDGSASSDPDNDPITYKWTAPSGITLSSTTIDKPTFTAPTVSANTDYTFSLVVNDGILDSPADQVKITVKVGNKAPVANAGPDQSINENTVVTLDGSASSDSDNDQLTYLWTAPGGITLSSTTASKPTFTAPEVTTNTSYTFSLVVNDGTVSSPADQVVVTVNQVNKVPVANAGPDQSINKNLLVTLDGSASSDGDGSALTYKWTAPAEITLSSTTVSNPTFTAPDVTTNTNYTFSLVVNDGTVDSPDDQVVITVKNSHFLLAFIGSGQNHMPINVITAADGGLNLEAGDEIAVFDGSVCCGVKILTQSINVNDFNTFADIAASQTEAGQSNGYTTGHTITYKFWDKSENLELSSIKAEYFALNGTTITAPTFEAGLSALVKLYVNHAPTANAGADQSLNEGLLVTLDGSASSDPDGNTLTYLWTAPSGITLSSTTASKPTFTAPEVTANTDYTLSLVVNDGNLNSTSDQVVVTVKQVNKAPVANAGLDNSVNENTLFTLDGSASSDPDGNPITYKWTAPAEITLSSTTAAKPTFTAPTVVANTDYTFSLVVNDGILDSPADQVKITVKVGNKAPVANAGPDQSPNENTVVTLDGSASSDPDNDQLTYLWTAPTGITLSSTTASKPTFTAPEVTANTSYTFTLVVNDGTVASTADQVVITVNQVNKVPVANAGPDQSVNKGVTVTLDGSASSDPEGNTLTYQWTAPTGVTLSSNTASKPTFTAPEVLSSTNYTFSLVVNDGLIDSPADQVIITVNNTSATQHFVTAFTGNGLDHMPINVITATNGGVNLEAGDEIAVFDGSICCGVKILTQSINVNDFNTFADIAASKDDGSSNGYTTGHTITYKVWDKSENLESSSIIAEYFATDGTTTTAPTFEAGLSALVKLTVNHAPIANAGADQSLNEGLLVTLDGTASSDPDGNTLTYQWTAPSGITLSSTSASKPTFTAPEVSANTNYTFTLVVNDGYLNSTNDQILVTVKQVNKAPVANAGPDNSVNGNSLFTLDGSASSDPDNDPITYKWTAPAGITLSSLTESKPTFTAPTVLVNTDYTFSLVVNDGVLDSPADQVKITVKVGNSAPVANAGPDQSVNEGLLVTLDGSTSSDPDNDLLTYLWTAPSGITLSSTTASKPTFTAPEVTTNTSYTFTLVVNDGTVDSPVDQVVVTVNQVNKVPAANAGPDQSVNEGVTVTLDGSASSDPDGNTLSYKWTAPAGITLNSTTAAKPTFTAPEVSANTNYTFSLVVNDGSLDSPADQVVITVKNTSATQHFLPAFSGNGFDQMAINVLSATNGILDLEAGDEIAVFDGSICCGMVILTKPVSMADYVSIAASKNDGSSNGYTTGHTITYKFWDKSASLELSSIIPVYYDPVTGDPTTASTFAAGESAFVKLTANHVPIADAGTDQTINEGSTVTLDGTASSDPDNDALTYLWTAPSGITLSSNTSSKVTFTAPEITTDTDYSFSLVVNDGKVNSTADLVVVKVKQVNKAPIANAGADQTLNEGSAVTLDGTASSDPDNDAFTYLWTAPSGITLSSSTASKPTFTAPEVITDTDYTFSLVVNDGTLNSPADQVTIKVKQVNKVPTANAGTDQTINEGSTVTLDGTASSDLDNDALTYQWTAPTGITLSSTTASKPTFTAPEVSTDTDYSFSLVVNDGKADSPADQVTILVKQVNKAPIANAGADQIQNEGSTVTLDGTASSDPDNDALTYLWTAPAGITLSSTTASKPTFTAPAVVTNTEYSFSLVVNDGYVNSASKSVKILVKLIPKHFKTVWTGNGTDHMNIHLISAKTDDIDLETGDEIGIFDGTKCVGAGIVSTTLNTENILDIVVSMNDGSGNGYTPGNTILYKFYHKSLDSELTTITAGYLNTDPTWSTDGKFAAGSSAMVNLSGLTIISQDFVLNIGWNIISANVVPSNLNLKDIFQPLINAGTLKKVMDESGKSIENFGVLGGWKNNIGNLIATEGYKVNMITASNLSIQGTPVQLPLDIPLNIGWNIISYPSANSQDAKALVQSLIDAGKLKKVMDETGKSIENFGVLGGWKNNIGNFVPGKGYKVNVLAACTLTIPTSTKAAILVPEVLASTHFAKVYIGNGTDHMNINLVDLQASGLQAGDEIGIFDGKLCVGSATVGAEQLRIGSISLSASANDETGTEANGFTPGNPIILRLFKNNQEYRMSPEILNNSYSAFAKGESMFARVNSELATSLGELNGQVSIKCYPNPFNELLRIDIQFQNSKKLEVKIYDINGKMVRNLYNGNAEERTELFWDGNNEQGVRVVSGSYYLKANEVVEKIVLRN